MNEIKRDTYLQRLIDKKENGLIKVITGIKRYGKSYLLFYLYHDYLISQGINEDQILKIPLDDDMFTQYRDPAELSKYIRFPLKSITTLLAVTNQRLMKNMQCMEECHLLYQRKMIWEKCNRKGMRYSHNDLSMPLYPTHSSDCITYLSKSTAFQM